MKLRSIAIIAAVPILAIGWYAFRPERLFIDAAVDEAASVSTADAIVARGTFQGVAHEGRGQASVYRRADGTRVLRLSDFETSNGPDLQLYLVAARDARDNETVTNAGFVSLGALKGNVGSQNYEVPADVDLEK